MVELVDVGRERVQPSRRGGLRPLGTAASHRAGAVAALFVTGFGTFVNLYAPQPLLPLFRDLFRASELSVSLTVSAPILAVALVAPLVGVFADVLGRKRVIVAAMLALAIPTAMAATAGSLRALIFWRFLQGLCVPGIITVAIAYISEEAPPGAVGSTMATYVTGTVVGGFSGRFLSGMMATHAGWRAAFLLLGALTLLGGLVTWGALPRSTKFVRQRSATASVRALGAHLRNPQLLATYAVGFNVLLTLVGAFTYVNFYLADRPFGLGPAALSSVFAVYLIGAGLTPVAGRLIDRFGYRRALIGAVSLSALGMALTLLPALTFVVAGLALCCSGVFVSQSAASSQVGKAAGHARSSAAGLYASLYYLGGAVGSLLPGLFWQAAGWKGCVAFILAVQLVTGLTAYLAWED